MENPGAKGLFVVIGSWFRSFSNFRSDGRMRSKDLDKWNFQDEVFGGIDRLHGSQTVAEFKRFAIKIREGGYGP